MDNELLNLKRDENLEKTILGALLKDDSHIESINDYLKETDFSNPDHKLIYKSIIELWKSNRSVDIVILINHL